MNKLNDSSAKHGKSRRVIVPPPQFSIVSAVYNVAPYIERFIESLNQQTIESSQFELILVDDCSTDKSIALAKSALQQSSFRWKILKTKSNSGQASARNLGMEHATGRWLSIADPDDWLSKDYFSVLQQSIFKHGLDSTIGTSPIDIISTQPILFDEKTQTSRRHWRAKQYGNSGTKLYDLNVDPDVWPLSPGPIYRIASVRKTKIQFRTDIKPNFEDMMFTAELLIRTKSSFFLCVSGSKYMYRKRASKDSTIDLSLKDPRKFIDVIEKGYCRLLKMTQRYPAATAWAHMIVINDLGWIVRDYYSDAPVMFLDRKYVKRHLQAMRRISNLFDPELVLSASMSGLTQEQLAILATGFNSRMLAPKVATRKNLNNKIAISLSHSPAYKINTVSFRDVNARKVTPQGNRVQGTYYYEQLVQVKQTFYLPVINSGALELWVNGSRLQIWTNNSSDPSRQRYLEELARFKRKKEKVLHNVRSSPKPEAILAIGRLIRQLIRLRIKLALASAYYRYLSAR